MRLYLAGCENGDGERALSGLQNLSFLFSYYYVKGKVERFIDNAVKKKQPVMLDSGAFSALHSKAVINIDKYIEYIKENEHRFTKIVALDVIGDWRGSDKNLEYMKSKGVTPMPVFHTNEPFDYLEHLFKENNLLGLGVTGSKLRQPEIIKWLIRVFEIRNKINPVCKMHGLALTSSKIMSFFDWDSCDSSTFSSGRRFGFIYHIDGNRLVSYPRDRWKKIIGKVPDDCFINRKPTMEQSDKLMRHNAKTMLDFVDMINKGKAVVSPRPTV